MKNLRRAFSLCCILLLSGGPALADSATEQLTNQLVRQAQDLQAAVNGHHGDRAIATDIHRLRNTLLQLEQSVLFSGQTPDSDGATSSISGSCKLDVGGNIFKPETVISCSVYGQGAIAYEINVIARNKEEIAFQGKLNPGLASQEFTTNSQEVGGNLVTYQVFVFTQNGKRELIKTFPGKNN